MAVVNISNNVTLYVYYKIAFANSAVCLLAVKQLHQAIALRYPKLSIHQQKRPNPDANNQETWMETYAGVEQSQLDNLMADLSELAKLHGLPDERKTEVFINL